MMFILSDFVLHQDQKQKTFCGQLSGQKKLKKSVDFFRNGYYSKREPGLGLSRL